MKTLQKFTDTNLERSRELSPDEIVKFLDDFRQLHGSSRPKSKLISIKIPENLLSAFKTKASINGVPYQTQIKRLMRAWLDE